MATFEKRSGGWRAKVRKNGVNESRTFPTKSQAQAWAVDRERDLDNVAAGGVPRKTVREALERYRDEVSPTKRGARWEQIRINGWLGHVHAVTGKESSQKLMWLDRQIADICQQDISAWRDARKSVVSDGSVIREMSLMGAVFEMARREWRWVLRSPLKDVRKPSHPQARTRRISEREIEALCVALGWDNEPVQTQTAEVAGAFLLAIETAMRQGEILGLTWDRINFDRCVAHLPMTKNGTARDVPLSSRAIEILKLLVGRDQERVFTVASASADALFRKGKARAMIEELHFHDSRREAISRLSKKVDVLTLARITGHKDIRMLMIYYQTDMSEVAQRLG